MAHGIECSLIVFCVGGLFLALEVFELPYLLILQGTQLALLTRREAEAPVAAKGVREFPGPSRRPQPAVAGRFNPRPAGAARPAGGRAF
jgi:hypothetical protein